MVTVEQMNLSRLERLGKTLGLSVYDTQGLLAAVGPELRSKLAESMAREERYSTAEESAQMLAESSAMRANLGQMSDAKRAGVSREWSDNNRHALVFGHTAGDRCNSTCRGK